MVLVKKIKYKEKLMNPTSKRNLSSKLNNWKDYTFTLLVNLELFVQAWMNAVSKDWLEKFRKVRQIDAYYLFENLMYIC